MAGSGQKGRLRLHNTADSLDIFSISVLCPGNYPHRGQQPDRVHDRPALLPLLALLHRRGPGRQRAHFPRQRRRSGGRDAGVQHCGGVARHLAQGCGHRSGRIQVKSLFNVRPYCCTPNTIEGKY